MLCNLRLYSFFGGLKRQDITPDAFMIQALAQNKPPVLPGELEIFRYKKASFC